MTILATTMAVVILLFSWIIPPTDGPKLGTSAVYEKQAIYMLNEIRTASNVPALDANPRVYTVAKRYAYQWISAGNDCDGDYTEPEEVWYNRFDKAGYKAEDYAVLIACGWALPSDALYAFAVFGAADAMLNPEAEDISIIYQWSYELNHGIILLLLSMEDDAEKECSSCVSA